MLLFIKSILQLRSQQEKNDIDRCYRENTVVKISSETVFIMVTGQRSLFLNPNHYGQHTNRYINN